MIDEIQGGGTLAESLRSQSKYLPGMFIETMVAGEVAGRLDVVLDDLARHYKQVLDFKRLYWQGAMYPIMLLVTAIIIIPYVQGLVFSQDSVEVYTLKFLWRLARSYGTPFLIILVLARLGILRRITDPIFSRLWPVAGYWRRFALARFCRCMGMMLGAGLSVRQSIERSAAVTSHPQLKLALRKAVPLVQQGETLGRALQQTGAFSSLMNEMVHTGELSGRDEELFYKVADYLYAEAVFPVQVIGMRLTAYLILAFFVLGILTMVLSWVLALLMQSLA